MNRNRDRSAVHSGRLLLIVFAALIFVMSLAALAIWAASWRIPSSKELVRELQGDQDPMVRRHAAWWLGEHEYRGAVSALIEALSDESADVRLVAAWALGEIKDEYSIPALVRTLDDEDLLVREMAVLAIGEIENPSAVPVLSDVFDEEKELRGAVIWALGEIRGKEARIARDEAFDKWGRRSWKNDQVWAGNLYKDAKVRGSKERREVDWPHYSEDLGKLLDQLRTGSEEERRRAAFNLGLIGVADRWESMPDLEQAVAGLLDALRDPVPEVRAMAIWSLDETNPSRSHRH